MQIRDKVRILMMALVKAQDIEVNKRIQMIDCFCMP